MPKPRVRQQQDDDDDLDGGSFTEAQRAELGDMIGKTVSGLVKRRLPAIVKDAITPAMAELRDQISGVGSGGRDNRSDPDDDEPDPDDIDDRQDRRRGVDQRLAGRDRGAGDRDGGRRSDRGGRRDPEPELERGRGRGGAGNNTQIHRLQTKLERLESEAAKERETARNATRDATLREMLAAGGVDKNRVRGAVALLREATRFDDKGGEWLFAGAEEDTDLDAGVKAWLNTDEGKSFMGPPTSGGGGGGGGNAYPAPQLRRSGAGTRASSGGPSGSSRPAQDARGAKQERVAAAQQQLAGAVDQLVTGSIAIG